MNKPHTVLYQSQVLKKSNFPHNRQSTRRATSRVGFWLPHLKLPLTPGFHQPRGQRHTPPPNKETSQSFIFLLLFLPPPLFGTCMALLHPTEKGGPLVFFSPSEIRWRNATLCNVLVYVVPRFGDTLRLFHHLSTLSDATTAIIQRLNPFSPSIPLASSRGAQILSFNICAGP